MPKLTDTIGSGITERRVVAYDWDVPGDADAQVQGAIAAFDRSSFARIVQRLTELTTPMLTAAGLPSDPERAYVVRLAGTWVVLDEAVDPEFEIEKGSRFLSLDELLLHLGHQPDSPEGYAARVLRILSTAQYQLQAGSHDEAMASAFAAGALVTEASMKGMFERDVLIGEKVREGGQRAHEQTYGTEDKKQAKRQAYLEAFDRERVKGSGITEAYEVVGDRFGVNPKTIQRAVEGRKSKG